MAQNGTANGTSTARKGRRTEADRTLELLQSLPEGIQIGFWRDGRRKPFYLRHGRQRFVESFESERTRNDAAERMAAGLHLNGVEFIETDPAEWREWKAFRARCPAPLHELEAAWHASRALPTKISVLTKDAAKKYLELRLAEDMERDSDTHRHVKLHLKRLCDGHGDMPLTSLTADMIRDLLNTLTSQKTGKGVGKVTKRHHRKDWNTFFRRCIAEEWMTKNPCSAVKPPRVEPEDKVPLKPREIFDLLKHNRNEPVVGRLVLELFGGLRAASAERLKKDDIRFDARGIRMPGARKDDETGEQRRHHKSGKTKYRQGHPSVLWAWLNHAPEACWTDINPGNYGYKKSQAFIRARVNNPGNVLRDSFASYHLAVFRDPPLTSHLMQHKNMSQTETYEGVADEADGKLVMAMTPTTVLMDWEDFISLHHDQHHGSSSQIGSG